MIKETPSLFVPSPSTNQGHSVDSFLNRHAQEFVFYGSGKAALYDGLAGLIEPGETVLVPAYLPDAVVEPLYDLELETEYYALEPSLAPDFVDLERRLDDDVIAVMSVNYFGFPHPGLDELRSIVADYGCYHVDDNAHAPLSVDGETVLGTRGHLGVTSLWKLFPVPDGAILYLNDEQAAEAYDPSSSAGVRDGFDGSDCRYLLKSAFRDVFDRNGTIRRSIDAILASRNDGRSVGGPRERYEKGKRPMSKLSAYVVEESDPRAIRQARRQNYLAWRQALESRDDVEFVFESLPEGICPQVAPVRAAGHEQFRAELDRCGVGGAKRWPRLSPRVREKPTYETATRLAREIVTLPVHQHIAPSTILDVGRQLRQ
ncbi:DegT/DnrJ/EryC1/StrS family aminotransferase [Natrarchaeobaculum sulfurireducens]|uniref:DegT/DnrJ/EryC1/StrS family aminotransferase n=1 Tax=Natrarchaeobaculum sulfurireducens TaxID=2044521 RepID=UPI000E3C1F4F|nr:DegT/DnrJ/EryC1/StrS family aminotransferase [Natrarchaeobaculum sulfurireducens]